MDGLSIESDEDSGPEGMILGENDCPAFEKIDSACLHLFFNVVPSTDVDDLHDFLEKAWAESAEFTMKIIFNLGNVRKDGGGKQDRQNFYFSMLWLWKKNSDLVVRNARLIHQHTSLKCLLDILMYIVHLDQASQYNIHNLIAARQKHKEHKSEIRGVLKKDRREAGHYNRLKLWTEFAVSVGKQSYGELRLERTKEELISTDKNILRDPRVTSRWISEDIANQFQLFCKNRDANLKNIIKEEKKEERKQIKNILRSAKDTKNIKNLYTEVIAVFTEGIKEELDVMKEIEQGSKKTVGGLFAKWAPKEKGMHDLATGISQDLMLTLLPAVGESIVRASQTYQRILSKIHEASQVPEHYVGSNRFSEVNYDRMASRCRLLWGEKVFKANDPERYDEYLKKSAVTSLTNKTAKEGVKTGVLLPHELVKKVQTLGDNTPENLMTRMEINLQWRGIVKATMDALKAGEGCGVCLPMCDVSGSMQGTPMEVSVALSMLLAESLPKNNPLHGKILTFETRPNMCDLQGVPDYEAEVDTSDLSNVEDIMKQLGDFGARVNAVLRYGWGGSTNIEAAYDLLLDVARSRKLQPEYVEKICLVIFSDMEFDMAVQEDYYHRPNRNRKPRNWTTMHEHITTKFARAGYPKIPKTVYWNLRASESQPIQDSQKKDVVLLSGFSSGLLKTFLKGAWDQFTPWHQMVQALSGPLYEKIVFD